MQRVAVVGSGGAGKTTFSRELGSRLGLPVIHLDHYFWQPGWTPTSAQQWRETVAKLITGQRWVIDGNYAGSLDLRLERADTVIILNFSRWRCLAGVLHRWWTHRGQAVQAQGCPERLDWHFLRWVWRYPIDSRPRLSDALAQSTGNPNVVELTSLAAARLFLSGLPARTERGRRELNN